MQLLVKQKVIKIHCTTEVIVRLMHPNYTDEQVAYISKFLCRAIRTKRGVNLNGFHIIGGERGWFYIVRNNTKHQLRCVTEAFIKEQRIL